jgi:secondary thiamine-phosphate synthase enzyme
VKTPRSVARTPLTTVTAAAVVSTTLTVETGGVGFVDLTGEIEGFVEDAGGVEGFALLFCRHTSASLTIQENADPSVLDDLITVLNRLAPTDAGWTHRTEGPDDMPAHVKTMLTTTALQIPWQACAWSVAGDLPHRTPDPPAPPGDCGSVYRHQALKHGPLFNSPWPSTRLTPSRPTRLDKSPRRVLFVFS